VTVENVRAFTIYLQSKETKFDNNPFILNKNGRLSTSYINGCIRPLRAFSTWLQEEGYLDENVLKPVRPPKIRKKLITILTDEEVAALLAVPDQDDPFGARNFAMLWFMLDGGFRANEVCGLTLDNARLEDGFLKVLGKGDKERFVPVGAGAQSAGLRWRDHFRPVFAQGPSDGLFLNANGQPLSVNALECAVKKIGAKAGVPRIYCHLLRHTFATNYLARGVGDPFRLQQILGHTSLEMVRHYVALANVQQSLLESRTSVMDMFSQERGNLGSRRLRQPRRRRGTRHVRTSASLGVFPDKSRAVPASTGRR